MTHVKIAKLKTQLSRYLRQVRRGEEVIVTDRDTPIARVLPFKSASEHLIIKTAPRSLKAFLKIKILAAPKHTDSLHALLEDRAENERP